MEHSPAFAWTALRAIKLSGVETLNKVTEVGAKQVELNVVLRKPHGSLEENKGSIRISQNLNLVVKLRRVCPTGWFYPAGNGQCRSYHTGIADRRSGRQRLRFQHLGSCCKPSNQLVALLVVHQQKRSFCCLGIVTIKVVKVVAEVLPSQYLEGPGCMSKKLLQ